ncbi:MAG: S1 RNA-binding domain-containing protein [Deltaproteobacteria bacterium]|nr:S1 RNA-binding domain-containing protein [Deltaproteobacteria bacterium]
MEDNELDTRAEEEMPDPTEVDEEEDFSALFEESLKKVKKRVQTDSQVSGTVVSIGEEWAFVDIGGKSEGVIATQELLGENGEPTVSVGDPISAYVVSTRDGETVLSVKMTAAASSESLEGAYRSGLPVEGVVASERKGGYQVRVFGKEAFCPYSQMDLRGVSDPEGYVGKKLVFRIAEYENGGRNIVLSRRQILEEERQKMVDQLRQSLHVGDLIPAFVTKLAPYGAFADIGGIEGLIPMSELAWHRVASASDILTPGDTVSVKVLDLDWKGGRISLSLKATQEDPWITVEERYTEGAIMTGQVMRLAQFGAFVQLEPGIEGLLHISGLGLGRRVAHPREVVSEGEELQVRIVSVDAAARRIGLELNFPSADDKEGTQEDLQPGAVLEGTVDAIKPYGAFILLPGGKTGLLHISEMAGDTTGDLRRKYPQGSSVTVQVLNVDPGAGKISLSTKGLKEAEETRAFKAYQGEKGGSGSFGTLAAVFKKANRKERSFQK